VKVPVFWVPLPLNLAMTFPCPDPPLLAWLGDGAGTVCVTVAAGAVTFAVTVGPGTVLTWSLMTVCVLVTVCVTVTAGL
jgi:hypothetical protein